MIKNKGYVFHTTNNDINEFELLNESVVFLFPFDIITKVLENEKEFSFLDEYNQGYPLFEENKKQILFFKSENFYCELYTENFQIIFNIQDKKIVIAYTELSENEKSGISNLYFNDQSFSKIYIALGIFIDRIELSIYSTASKLINDNNIPVNRGIEYFEKTLKGNYKLDSNTKKLISKNAIEEKIEYLNEDELISTIRKIISSLNDYLFMYGGDSLFWDRVEKNGKKTKEPKTEIDAQHSISIMLGDKINKAGLELYKEPNTQVGNIDFYITGNVKNKGIFGVCLEIKNVHSRKLKDGFISQLPAYVKRKNALFGIYLTLWYNFEEFDIYDEYENFHGPADGLNILKQNIKYSSTLNNMYAYSLDVSRPTQASRL